VFDENARSVKEQKGELVCTRPFPSLPVGFWNDPDGMKYRGGLLREVSRGVDARRLVRDHRSRWHDHLRQVRCGCSTRAACASERPRSTRQVEQLDEVVESLVIGQTWPPGEIGGRARGAFRQAARGLALDDGLIARIKQQIRVNTTPRHVPAKVVQVSDIPRTKSNKIVELAVRERRARATGEEPRGARESRGGSSMQRYSATAGIL